MLKQVTLKNFRRHEDLTVNFTDGLNVIRAVNEGGKTTLLEAASYALYGVKALRTPLAETVTWGRNEKDLKVELVIEVEDKVYVFSRSKAGAEVTLDGNVFVTGQNEVSAFAAQLLGADVNTANILMFAGQNSLRGTLDNGPKATSQTIEQLADLDLFDRILDAANEKLPLGAPTLFEERLKGLKAQIEMLDLPERPDEDTFNVLDLGLARTIVELENELVPARADAQARFDAFNAESDKRWKRDSLRQDIDKYETQRRDTEAKRAQELERTFPSNLEGVILDLKSKVEMEAGHTARIEAYRKFEAAPAFGSVKQMPVAELQAMLKHYQTTLSERRNHITTLRGDIKALEAAIVSGSVCGFCGVDVTTYPEVATKNAATRAEIEAKHKEIAETEDWVSADKAVISEIEDALDAQTKVERLIKQIGAHVEVDESVTPNRVMWKGEVPSGEATDSTPRLREAEAQLKALHARDAKVEAFDAVIAESSDKVLKFHDQIGDLALAPDEEFEALQQAFALASSKVTTLEAEVATLKLQREEAVKVFAAAREAWVRAAETQTRLTSEIAQTEKDIASLAFNNALVKRVRAARPVVASKLWGLVLTSVSTLFSQMRGEKSVVTKGTGGFLVNGQSVESLSGSTKDLLGLAIRCALTHTFLPGCPFLVLDEPTAACDSSRAEALFGFVASAQFKQVLLVTHSDIGDALADNLIELV